MQMSTDGLVTRVVSTGDHDKVLQILTAEHGRISVMVKGGKSLRNPAMACSQLFTYGNFELYRKGDFYWLRQGSVLNAFYELSADIVRMSLGVYLCDVANELSDRDEPAEELLRMLLNSLYLIGRDKKPQELVKGVFELRAAAISGYLPELDACCRCGSIDERLNYLDVMNGRLLCAECLSRQSKLVRVPMVGADADGDREKSVLCAMTPAVTAAVRYVLHASPERIFSFELADAEDVTEFSRVAQTYLLNHLGRGFDSLDFYESVKPKGGSRG